MDLRLDGQKCPSWLMPGPIVGPGRDHGAAVICSGASAQTAVDCCGFYMDLHPGNVGFGAHKWLQNQRKPPQFGSNVCFQTSPDAASHFEDLDSQRVCMKLSWKGGKSLPGTGVWKNPSSW